MKLSLAPYVLYVNCVDVVNQMPSGVLCSTVNRRIIKSEPLHLRGKEKAQQILFYFCCFFFGEFFILWDLRELESWCDPCQFGKAIKTSLANGFFLFPNSPFFTLHFCLPSLEDGQLGKICSCVTNCPLLYCKIFFFLLSIISALSDFFLCLSFKSCIYNF